MQKKTCSTIFLSPLCLVLHWKGNFFFSLRDSVASGPTLAIPLDDAPFRVEADSSGSATGALLSRFQDATWRYPNPWTTLNEITIFMTVNPSQSLACEHSLNGANAFTDLHLPSEISPTIKMFNTSWCQTRWSLELSEFNFNLVYKLGSSIICSDALSRRPDYDSGSDDNDNIMVI